MAFRPMKLSDVKARTGIVSMTVDQARKIANAADYPKDKRAHAAALRAPSIAPMKGDSIYVIDSRRGRYFNRMTREQQRVRLVEQRYYDWLRERDASLLAAE